MIFYDGELHPGRITVVEADRVKVMCLERSEKYYRWPAKKDEIFYAFSEVKKKLKEPKLMRRGFFYFRELCQYVFE